MEGDKIYLTSKEQEEVRKCLLYFDHKQLGKKPKKPNRRKLIQRREPQLNDCSQDLEEDPMASLSNVKDLEQSKSNEKAELSEHIVTSKIEQLPAESQQVEQKSSKMKEKNLANVGKKDFGKDNEKPQNPAASGDQKSREKILAEREAKRLAKQLAKSKKDGSYNKKGDKSEGQISAKPSQKNLIEQSDNTASRTGTVPSVNIEKNKKAEQEILPKQDTQNAEQLTAINKNEKEILVGQHVRQNENSATGEKSKAELRAERRAKQEMQRAAKEDGKRALAKQEKKISEVADKKPTPTELKTPQEEKQTLIKKLVCHQRVKLFSHLNFELNPTLPMQIINVHTAIVELGAKYAARIVSGSNARCIALLQALKKVINDYTTPAEKEFSRGLETILGDSMAYLNHCRPSSVSMTNALKHIKSHLTQLPNNISDEDAKRKMCDVIDTFIREQIDVAGEAIRYAVQKKIANGDVILICACSSLLFRILEESHREGKVFKVIVVDGGPWFEGREMLRRLVNLGINCTYVLVSALSFIMALTTKVLIGAHALLANGYVMSRAGSSLVALMAKSYNVPVLVCCETYKFCERVQTDVFVYNELGKPDDLVSMDKRLNAWESTPYLTPLSLFYDITPPDLVTAVVTEIAILPCTSVPVILRIKPSDMVV